MAAIFASFALLLLATLVPALFGRAYLPALHGRDNHALFPFLYSALHGSLFLPPCLCLPLHTRMHFGFQDGFTWLEPAFKHARYKTRWHTYIDNTYYAFTARALPLAACAFY